MQRSQYAEKMAMLHALEKFLLVVSKSEPEDWSTSDRIVVYRVLLDQCITVSDFVVPQMAKHDKTIKKFTMVDDIPIAPTKAVVDLPIIDMHKSGIRDPTCYFSGLTFSLDNSIKWVHVPVDYQYPADDVPSPTISNSSFSVSHVNSQLSDVSNQSMSVNGGGGTKTSPVALLTVMCRLMAARELATSDAARYEVRTSFRSCII